MQACAVTARAENHVVQHNARKTYKMLTAKVLRYQANWAAVFGQAFVLTKAETLVAKSLEGVTDAEVLGLTTLATVV